MPDPIFPIVKGLGWTVERLPTFEGNIVQRTVTGKELGIAQQSMPQWTIRLHYEYLWNKTFGTNNPLKTLLGFWLARGADVQTWLWEDPEFKSVTDQNFGTGNGTATKFQLVQSIGEFNETVKEINGAPTIKKAGVILATPLDYTIDTKGLVTFAIAPAASAALTWTGNFYRRCRFARNQAQFSQFMFQLHSLREIEFRTQL